MRSLQWYKRGAAYPVSTKTRRLIEGMPFSQMPWKTGIASTSLRCVSWKWHGDSTNYLPKWKWKMDQHCAPKWEATSVAKDNTTDTNWDNWNSCRNNRHISNSSSPDTDIKMLNSTISQKRLISLKANLFLCPPDVPAMPFKRSHREHVTGYRWTRDGQLENKWRAVIARTTGNECPIYQLTFPDFCRHFFTL